MQVSNYQALQTLYRSGTSANNLVKDYYKKKNPTRVEKILANYKPKDLNALRYALKASTEKLEDVRLLIKHNINIDEHPSMFGYYLMAENMLTYENVISHYRKFPGRKANIAMYHLIKEAFNPEEVYQKLRQDGVDDVDIMYFPLPAEIKNNIFLVDAETGFNYVMKLFKEGYHKIDFVVYDFIRFTEDKVNMAQRFLDEGIPIEFIGRKDMIACLEKKLTVKELKLSYDFNSPYFNSMFRYFIDNHVSFGFKTLEDLLKALVKIGIDKDTILSGKRV